MAKDGLIVLMLTLVAAWCIPAAGDVVNFPDANLEQEIRDALNIPSPTPITQADMANLEWLQCGPGGIENLGGLESASNLWSLWVWGNDVSDLSPIAGLSSLLDANLSNCQIQELPSNHAWSSILSLSLSGNQISDISPLSNMTSLSGLSLSNNRISDISPLAPLNVWMVLDIGGNQISDIAPLSDLEVISRLDLRDNPLNQEAYDVYLPMIQVNNPEALILYDPIPEPSAAMFLSLGAYTLIGKSPIVFHISHLTR